MYRQFFNLTDTPFKKSLQIEKLFFSPQFNELFARFEFLKCNRGFMLFTGDSGTGKTTAIRYLFETIKKSSFLPVYLQLSTVTPIEFYRQLNSALGGELLFRKCDLFASIQKLILDFSINKNRIPIIVLDESHFLKNNIFFELQLMLNFNIDSLDPAIIIMVGHPHLYHRLNAPVYTSLFNRINIFFNLPYLSKSESFEYINHHLKISGAKTEIFNQNALNTIFNISNGNIRLINRLAFDAILYATQNKKDLIDENIIFIVSNYSNKKE